MALKAGLINRIHNTNAHDVVHSSAYAKVQNTHAANQHSSMAFSVRKEIEKNRTHVKGYSDSIVSKGGNKMPRATSVEMQNADNLLRHQGGYGRTPGDKESLRKGYGRVSGDRNELHKGYGREAGDRNSLHKGYGRTAGDKDSLRGGYGRTEGNRDSLHGGYGRTSTAGIVSAPKSTNRFYSNNWYSDSK